MSWSLLAGVAVGVVVATLSLRRLFRLRPAPDGPPVGLQVLFEAFHGRQYFRVGVLAASTEAEAAALLKPFLEKRGERFVEIDPADTRPVSTVSEAWRANGVPAEGVLGLSGRIWVDEKKT